MPESFAYLNGLWLPQSQATLPLNDAGFVMGVTVTDFVRTFKHKLDHWPEHLARFQENVKAAWIEWPHTDDDLTAIANELTRRNAALLPPGQDLALIVFATPGRIGYYLGDPGGAGDAQATLGMHTFPLPFARYREMIQFGEILRVPDMVEAVPMTCIPPKLKHRSRMHWWLAEREVWSWDFGHSKALLLNDAGNVTETSFANVLIVKGGHVISPPRDTILPGVSLATVEQLCAEIGVTFHERELSVKDCLTADEMFLCGTAFCLASVRQLNDVTFPLHGDCISRLLDAWNARVGIDIHGQILGE